MNVNLRLFEITRILVCFNYVASRIVNPNHRRHVIGCDASRNPTALLAASDPPYHSPPNGSAAEIRSTPR